MANQKNYRAIVVLFCVSLLLTACRKYEKEETTVNWEIVDPFTGEPWEGVTVKIVAETYKGGLKLSKKETTSETIFEGKTDANGKISHTYHAKKRGVRCYVALIDMDYFGNYGQDYTIYKNPGIHCLVSGETYEHRWEVNMDAFLQEYKKNVNCFDDKDTLNVQAYFWNYLRIEKHKVRNFTLNGCYDHDPKDDEQTGSPLGYIRRNSGWYHYEWSVIRNGQTSFFKDSIYLEPGGMQRFELFY
jgi:hypothetical protein